MKLVKGNSTYRELGKTWDMPPDLYSKLEEFVCQMYVSSTTINNVNEFRNNLFCVKCGDMESHPTIKLPFGGSACRVNQLCLIQDMDGLPIVMVVSQLSGCRDHQHQKLFYN